MSENNENSSKTITEILIEMIPYDDLSQEPRLKFIVDIDSPLSSFVEHISDKFNIPAGIVSLYFNDKKLEMDSTFDENGIKEGDQLKIEFSSDNFDPEKANKCLIETSLLLSDIITKAAEYQCILNSENINLANQKLKNFIVFCEEMAPKISEKVDALPKRY